MRKFLLGAFLMFFAGVGASAAAVVEPAFPRDAASLKALDDQQLRVVRRAGALCWHSAGTGRGAAHRGCVISETEGAIRRTNNTALLAYHQTLPVHARYDEYRPAFYWQRLVSP